jgi:hypothetical protein
MPSRGLQWGILPRRFSTAPWIVVSGAELRFLLSLFATMQKFWTKGLASKGTGSAVLHGTRIHQGFKRACENSRETANLWVSKSVPQRLKPSSLTMVTARLNPCPSYRNAFSSTFFFGFVAPRQQFVQNAPSRLKAVKHLSRAHLRSSYELFLVLCHSVRNAPSVPLTGSDEGKGSCFMRASAVREGSFRHISQF